MAIKHIGRIQVRLRAGHVLDELLASFVQPDLCPPDQQRELFLEGLCASYVHGLLPQRMIDALRERGADLDGLLVRSRIYGQTATGLAPNLAQRDAPHASTRVSTDTSTDPLPGTDASNDISIPPPAVKPIPKPIQKAKSADDGKPKPFTREQIRSMAGLMGDDD